MKRQFMKSLMALCTGVMTLVAASSLFVSCYDDSKLWDKTDELDKRLQAVEALKTQLAELTARVDGLYTLQFGVNDDGKLQYSFDGKTWTATDVEFSVESECPEVSLVDNGDTVTIKVGDAEFTIEKPEEIQFEIRAGKLYFESEGVQTVTIKSSGIDDITVISCPKGWTADIDVDGMLVVTAPNYADTEPSYDEDYNEIPATAAWQGVIKVHACSTEGKCMVGKLSVEVSEQPIIVKAYSGNYYVTTVGWTKAYYGVSPRETFEEDAEVILDALKNDNYGLLEELPCVQGETAEGKISDMLGYEPKLGVEYVVYAIDSWADSFTLDNLVLAYYSPVDVTVEEDESKRSAYDVFVSISVEGADSYYAYAVPAMGGEIDVDFEKENLASQLANPYWLPAKLHTQDYEGSLYAVAEGTMGSAVGTEAPENECLLLIIPVDGRPMDEYTVDDVYTFMFETAALQSGGTVDATVTESKVNFFEVPLDPHTQLGVKVEAPATGWKYIYTQWISDEKYTLAGGEDELLVSMIAADPFAKAPIANAELPAIMVCDVLPGETAHFVAFVIDEAGKYGTVSKLTLTAEELQKSEISIVNLESNLADDGNLKNTTTLEVTFETDLTATSYKYVHVPSDWTIYEEYITLEPEQLADAVAVSDMAEVIEEGSLILEEHEYGTSYLLAVLPYEGDNPGKVAKVLTYDCLFELPEVLTDNFVDEPTVTFTVPEMKDGNWDETCYWFDGEAYSYYVNYKVAPVEGTEVVAVIVDPADLIEYGVNLAEMTPLEKASSLWAKSMNGVSYYIQNFVEEGESDIKSFWDYTGNALAPRILVSWKTADGKYFYKEIDLSAEFKKMLDNLKGDVVELSVVGKQWAFNWTEYAAMMGMENMSACLDFGVSQEGYFMAGIDYEAVYGPEAAGMWMAGVEGYFTAEATDATSGVIKIMTADWETGDLVYSGTSLEYSNLTETTCTFNGTGQFAELFVDVQATLMDEVVAVQSQGIGGM